MQSLLRTAHAQTVATTVSAPTLGITSLDGLFGLIINIVLGVGIALTIVFLILGGIQYITSRGDKTATETARNSITNAVIGFIIVIGAFAIKAVVENIFGSGPNSVTGVTPSGI